MRSMSFLLVSAVLLSATAAASAQADAPDPSRAGAPWSGTWTNMNNTMHVRAARCGDAMCGTVVWADDKTKADIAEKGRTLVGTQVFRNFRQTGPNEWKGQVYVPAIDKTITGKIQLTDGESITASACVFGFVGCETRHYKRIR
jgi:uncharacterized protein (DUF2147 family)